MNSPQKHTESIERLKSLLNKTEPRPPRRTLSADTSDVNSFFQIASQSFSQEDQATKNLSNNLTVTPNYKSHFGDLPKQVETKNSLTQFKPSIPTYQVQLSERQQLMEKINSHENTIIEIKETIKHSQELLQDIQQSCLSTNSLISTKDFEQTQKPQLRDCLSEISSIKKTLQSYSKSADDKFAIRETEIKETLSEISKNLITIESQYQKSLKELQSKIDSVIDVKNSIERGSSSKLISTLNNISTKLEILEQKIETPSDRNDLRSHKTRKSKTNLQRRSYDYSAPVKRKRDSPIMLDDRDFATLWTKSGNRKLLSKRGEVSPLIINPKNGREEFLNFQNLIQQKFLKRRKVN